MAAALIDFLRVTIPGLNRIRCTSVSGYGLPAGAHVDSQLQKEVGEAATLIALMTGVSVESAYVLFEVGARWGLVAIAFLCLQLEHPRKSCADRLGVSTPSLVTRLATCIS